MAKEFTNSIKIMENYITLNIIAHTGSSVRKIIKKENQYHIYTPKRPINGEANKDIIKLIAEKFKVPKSNVILIRGEKSKTKTFKVIPK